MKLQYKAIFFCYAITIADAIFKYLSIKQPNIGCFYNFVCFGLYKNYGIAFSFPVPMWITLASSLVIISLVCVCAFKYRSTNPAISSFLVLIVFGALNNFIDRLINNFTTDYLIFFGLSAINLADILILTGVIGILWYSRSKEDKLA